MSYYINRANQFTIGGKALAAGLYQWSESATEDTDETKYYDGDDDVTVLGVHRVFAFTCHDKSATSGSTSTTDAAQAFIWGLRNKTLADRNTTLVWKDVNGASETWNVTITDIVAGGGDATGKSGFSFNVHLNSLQSA